MEAEWASRTLNPRLDVGNFSHLMHMCEFNSQRFNRLPNVKRRKSHLVCVGQVYLWVRSSLDL